MTDIFDHRIVPMIYGLLNRDAADHDEPLDARLITDLDADSLDIVELTMLAEDEFGIEITDDEAEPFARDEGGAGGKTVRQFCELVQGKIVAKEGV